MADEATKSTSDTSSTKSDNAATNYSRGENQKNVTQSYRDNWNAIFGTKAKAKTKTTAKAKKKKR
jgi:hypothetical protein